jgi:hypothetical protein
MPDLDIHPTLLEIATAPRHPLVGNQQASSILEAEAMLTRGIPTKPPIIGFPSRTNGGCMFCNMSKRSDRKRVE